MNSLRRLFRNREGPTGLGASALLLLAGALAAYPFGTYEWAVLFLACGFLGLGLRTPAARTLSISARAKVRPSDRE
jgi:hypothetical protein